MDATYEWKGRIDILINNAGGGTKAEHVLLFEREPEKEIEGIYTNLVGVLFCCKEAARYKYYSHIECDSQSRSAQIRLPSNCPVLKIEMT